MKSDNPKPLKSAVNEEVASYELADESLDSLLQLQDQVLSETPNVPELQPGNHYRRYSIASVIAFVCLAMVGSVFYFSHSDYSEQIAREVVHNHLKLKPLDVEAKSLPGVRKNLTQLDFALVQSDVLQTRYHMSDQQLLGGRYCSVKGIPAAQLRYQVADRAMSRDSLRTLYQVPYNKELHGMIPHVDQGESATQVMMKGLYVYLWVERGLLMVLVSGDPVAEKIK
ncbi:MAG: hypothetical protein MI976_16145 [Pseudomonadales bacterium]|nr:hypothetical protein [Pseudomonadales bacterium]